MSEFDFPGLLEYLAGVDFTIVVAERDARGGDFEARSLEIDERTLELFRVEALKHIRSLSARELLDHRESTLLAETEASVTDRGILDPQILDVLIQAANRRPGAEGDPVPDRIRLYALVALDTRRTALLLRRQNPVRHLRGGVTRILFGSRLDEARPVFVYDGRFDVLVWNNEVLVAADNALDALFEDERLRRQQTDQAMAALARHVRSADAGLLRTVADDGAMAAKLRKMWKAGVFESVDPSQLAQVIDQFELDVQLEDGKLVLPAARTPRWELLALVEDAFVWGAASRRPYRANSKFGWSRRIVTGVRREGGRITTFLGRGAWSPVSIEDAADDQVHRKISYVIHGPESLRPLVIKPGADEGEYEASVLGAEGNDLLAALPET